MKVVFNKKLVTDRPYGGGNQVLFLLKKYLESKNIQVSFSLDDDTDVIVLMDVRDGGCLFPLKNVKEFKMSHKNVKVIHRINENDSHRIGSNQLNEMIKEGNKLADKTVFVSDWLREYFSNYGMKIDGSAVVLNGANRDLFFPKNNERTCSSPLRIITHHISDNILKGYETYRDLDDYCYRNPSIAKFTFVGRPLKGYIRDGSVIPSKFYSELPPLLQGNNVYITASMYEPGPNHLPEGMSCGLIPMVLSSASSCVEYSRGFNMLFDDSRDLFNKINKLYNDCELYGEMSKNMSLYTYGAREMCYEYYKIIVGLGG